MTVVEPSEAQLTYTVYCQNVQMGETFVSTARSLGKTIVTTWAEQALEQLKTDYPEYAATYTAEMRTQ